jgi:nucleotidyltransferase substrate binding protein (TIGR01987 family)
VIAMERNEILKQLDRSYQKLLEALQIPVSQPLAIDGTIRRFESTYLIACETIYTFYQDCLKSGHSQRNCILEALQKGLIEDQNAWQNLMVSKNHASFIYSELLIKEVYESVKKNHHAFHSLITGFRKVTHH